MIAARILVLHNQPVLPEDHPEAEAEHEVLEVTNIVSRALRQAGYRVSRLGIGSDPAPLLRRLKRNRPDAVFNLYEGTAHDGGSETVIAGLLQSLGVPFTGSPPSAMELARNKHHAKFLFQGAGLPTPEFFLVHALPMPEVPKEWPVIVKPAAQDASVGITQESIVTGLPELEARVRFVLDRFGPPVLVERFIRGREFNLALIETPEPRVLPPAEITFHELDKALWPIVSYDGKWAPGTPEFDLTPPIYPADVDPALLDRLFDLTRRAVQLVGCRDYARVDFRVDEAGRPFILEVNPNPDINPDAGLNGCLRSAGLSHNDFLALLVRNALSRNGKPHQVLSPSRG